MKRFYWQLSVLLFCVAFSACNRNGIKYRTNFADEIETQQNLVFTFEKDVVPDSLTNRWDSTDYISFTPKVAGAFKWNSQNELIFSPSTAFEPGTEYKAEFTGQTAKRGKKDVQIANGSFKFHTAPLHVENVTVAWAKAAGSGSIVVQTDVHFNYEVDVKQAFSKIQLSALDHSVTATLVNDGKDKKVAMQFAALTEKDMDVLLKIQVATGIPLSNGKTVMQKDTTINTVVPSRYNLSVLNVTAQHSGVEGIITVNTSQPVKGERLKECIRLEPETAFNITESDEGFIISSDKFQAGGTYSLSINTSMEGQFGGRMKAPYTTQVSFITPKPMIAFANSKGMYLSPKGFANVAVNVVNVPRVKVTVVKVYENNIEQLFRNGKRYDGEYDEKADEYHSWEYYSTTELGDEVYSEEIETSRLPKMNAAALLHLNVRDRLKGYDGTYVVTVRSTQHNYVQDSRIISLSDIGLIVKEDADNIYVFANSIKNATPLKDVKVSFISTTNAKVFTATTNAEGMAVYGGEKRKQDGFKIGMVTAKTGDDYNFLLLSASAIETSRFDVGGRIPNGSITMIYPERNLYRPGETVHVTAIVRNDNWDNPGGIPVKMRLVMPNGKEFATHRKILNAEGSCETAWEIPPTATTGMYTVEVYSGNDVLMGSYSISIEDFMPDRIKVAVNAERKEYRPGDVINVKLQADNLFGTPAAGRKYECYLGVDKLDMEAKDFKDYIFRLEKTIFPHFEPSSGQISPTGSADMKFQVPADMQYNGLFKGTFVSEVFDETGRPVHRYENIKIYTQQTFIGVKNDDRYVDIGRPVRIPMVAVDKDGRPMNNVQATVTVIKHNWHTYIEQSGNSYRFVSKPEDHVVSQNNIMISGSNYAYAVTPQTDGDYEVRVALPGTANYVKAQLWAWGSDGTPDFSAFEVNNEGNVTIKTDKDKYNAGENMDVLFSTPFEGRMLVTVERNHIMKHMYVETKNKTAKISLKADEESVPNVYISATLFRPMAADGMVLTVAHGFKPVYVEQKAYHLPVEITVAEKSRSKTRQTITVKTTPNAYVTIAAVDEGILQVKDFETPDPYAYFYQKVALATNTYDLYPQLLPELSANRFSTGGDGADESRMRANPLFVNRVKNVSFWSGIVQADGSGRVKYDMDIPQFSGDIRVMAVAYKGKGFGSSDKHLKVADPIVISAALPRFLSPGDETIMGVTLSNTTSKGNTATIKVEASGAVTIPGESMKTVTINANGEQHIEFRVKAASTIGTAKVTVTAMGMGEHFTNETELAVRPIASLQKVYDAGDVAAGRTADLNLTNDYMPGTFRGQLVVSGSPLAQFGNNLVYLIQYPYGCVEQTVSAAFPQLYYQDLVKAASINDGRQVNPAYNVQQAILKLQSMQLFNGSLAYWPGGNEESWWGSVYATHFLLEARKAGYDVNSVTIERLIQYLRAKVAKHETETLHYNNNLTREIVAKAIPYSLYVLALSGNPDHTNMNYYKANMNALSIDGKYLLAAAYSAAGMRDKAKQVMPASFGDERADQEDGGSFYSYTRDVALSLYALLDVDPDSRQAGTMVRMLQDEVKRNPHWNTQENAFCYLAMGKIARRVNATGTTADVVINGKTIATTKGDAVTVDLRNYPGATVQVKPRNGTCYWFSQRSGISASGSIKEEDSYLQVRRSYFSRTGQQLSGNSFKQNDLVVVRIALTSQFGDVENVAITDMLPACFEIENARLYTLPAMDWIKGDTRPDYLDIRDDRMNMFTSATRTTKYFYYMVRVVSPGTFKSGPVQADAMYNWAYHSYNGAGSIVVQ